MTTETTLADEADAAEQPEPAEEAEQAATDQGAPASGWRSYVAIGAAVVLFAASAGALGHALVAWQQADDDPALADAAARDRMLIAAAGAIEVLTSFDGTDVEAGLSQRSDVSTGELADAFASVSDEQRTILAERRRRSAVVGTSEGGSAIAATDFDAGAGTATVIALVDITDEPEDGDPASVRRHLVATVDEVDGRWLVSEINFAEVSAR